MISKDKTSDMEITAFGGQAEFITNINLNLMEATKEVSQTTIPEKITTIVKKKFTFIVGLPTIQPEGKLSTQTLKVQIVKILYTNDCTNAIFLHNLYE